jgi:DNA polymerase III subunit epsilon
MMRCACQQPSCGRCTASQWASDLQAKPYLVLDTETSGFTSSDDVLQIGIVDRCGREVFSSLIKPRDPIDERSEAFKTNGISNAMLADAPTFPEVYGVLSFWMTGCTVIAYNASFDKRMLESQCLRHSLPMPDSPWQCAMKRYSEYVGTFNPNSRKLLSHKLQKACSDMGVEAVPSHRTVADCLATWDLLKAMAG